MKNPGQIQKKKFNLQRASARTIIKMMMMMIMKIMIKMFMMMMIPASLGPSSVVSCRKAASEPRHPGPRAIAVVIAVMIF